MSNLDEEQLSGLLSAYIDGELDAAETQRVERILRQDATARRLLEELRRTVKLVSLLPRHQAPPSIGDEVRAQVERSTLLGDADSPSATRGGRWSSLRAWASMAAVLCVIAFGWWYVIVREGPEAARTTTVARKPQSSATEFTEKSTLGDPKEARLRSELAAAPSTPGEAKSTGVKIKEPGERGKGGPATPEETIVAAASLEQKIQAGMGAGAARTHSFDNEPVRLQVAVKSAAESDAVVAELTTHLRGRHVADLGETPSGEAERALGSQSFYYQGKPGSNFAPADEQQIIVRAPLADVNSLMEQLGREKIQKDRVTLQVGPLSVRGLEGAQGTLYALGETAKPREPVRAFDTSSDYREEYNRGGAAREAGSRTARRAGGLEELMRAMGVDPDLLRGMPGQEGESKPAGKEAHGPVASSIPEKVLEREPSLVRRRLDELAGSREGAEGAKPSPTPKGGKGNETPPAGEAESPVELGVAAQPYVTLVVQLTIDRPATKETPAPTENGKATIKKRQ